jgi:hypothetical protein
MDIISKVEAKERGLTRFFTNEPCKHGHIGERQVSSGQCTECTRIRVNGVRAADPEKARAKTRNWYAANSEKACEDSRRRYAEDRKTNPLRMMKDLWRAMIQRCTNPNNSRYAYRGGRGIKVCDRWRHGENGKTGFDLFVDDMKMRPSPKHSLDRKNNDGDYCPQNVVWSLAEQQAVNRRLRSDNKTGLKGVRRDNRTGRYISRIGRDGQRTYLGTFATADEAHAAYLKATAELELAA